MKKRRGFVYLDPEAATERWKGHVGPFGKLVIVAAKGDPEPLLKYFLDGPPTLSEDDCQWLVWLLERHLPRTGRPPGSRSGLGKRAKRDPRLAQKGHRNEVLRYAHILLHEGKRHWCLRNGRQRCTKKTAPLTRLAELAVDLTVERFPNFRDKMSAVNGDIIVDDSLPFKFKPMRLDFSEIAPELADDIQKIARAVRGLKL